MNECICHSYVISLVLKKLMAPQIAESSTGQRCPKAEVGKLRSAIWFVNRVLREHSCTCAGLFHTHSRAKWLPQTPWPTKREILTVISIQNVTCPRGSHSSLHTRSDQNECIPGEKQWRRGRGRGERTPPSFTCTHLSQTGALIPIYQRGNWDSFKVTDE